MADLFATINCTYCQEEIKGVRIQCCECDDFDICLQCFSVGAEIGPHKNDHAYKFVDQCPASVFGGRGAWTGKEQMQLLDAVEVYGFGNWELVSQHVETRTAEEVKEEYIARYLDGNIGKATWEPFANHRPVLVDHVPEDTGPLSPTVMNKLPPLNVTPEEACLLGYKPHRDDYEWEYNMEAEQIVTGLQLDPEEDTDIEVALKLFMVDMYVRKLRERVRRKRIVRDYQLAARYFTNLRDDPTKRLLTKQQRELRDKFRPFAQYMCMGEQERLIASVERERELRHRLSELMRYRSLGLTTQEEVVHYEQHAAFQKQQLMKQKSGSSGYAMMDFLQRNGKSEINQNSTERRSMWLTGNTSDGSFSCSSNSLSNPETGLEPLSLHRRPMGSLLSKNEIQLCAKLNLQPIHYATMKTTIIQENLHSPEKLRKYFSNHGILESGIRELIAEYLKGNGWLPKLPVL